MTLGTVRRAMKVGAYGWIAGLLAVILHGTLLVGGFAGAVIASLPGAYAVYLDAHGFFLFDGNQSMWDLARSEPVLGTLELAVLAVIPVAVLLACGAAMANRAESSGGAARAGASILLGYGTVLAITTALLFLQVGRASRTNDLSAALDVPILLRLAVAGILAPLVFGTIGGLARWHLSRS